MSEIDTSPYDPHARQPRTLGELERWMYAAEASKRAAMIPVPVPLNAPPIPGLDRLAAYCVATYRNILSVETVPRLIGEYPLACDVSTDEARATLLQDAADTLAPKSSTPNARESPSSAASGPIFTPGDLLRALDALDLVFQDEEPTEQEARIRQNNLVDRLQQRGITRSLARALIDDLIAKGVFQADGDFVDLQIFVGFDGKQTDQVTPNRYLRLARERWHGYLAKERGQRATSSPPLIDTRPDSPAPPESLIEAAMRGIPQTMADMDNESECDAPNPVPGRRIVQYDCLVRRLGDKRQHGKAASEWAIHRLVQRGILTARYGRTNLPAWQSRDGVRHGGDEVELLELKSSLIESTQGLWEWWHTLENEHGRTVNADPAAGSARVEIKENAPNANQPEHSEITRIRNVMDRLTAANERFMRSTLRLLVVPGPEDLTTLVSQLRPDRPPKLDVPVPPLDGLIVHDFLGAGVVEKASGRSNLLLLLVKGGQQSDEAAQYFCELAAESGRLYQTLPCYIAPIYSTTSPRNLWSTILYGRLQGTIWVIHGVGHEYIPFPFAASAELWRRLLYGTTPDGRIEAEPGSSGCPTGTIKPEGAVEADRVTTTFGPPSPPSGLTSLSASHTEGQEEAGPSDARPAEFLFNWREILDCLKLDNNEERRRQARELNERFDGPIILPGAGGQPKVRKDKLLSWWNGLEDRFREGQHSQMDKQATVDNQYAYGRNETVIPQIQGHVKKKRKKRSDQ